MNCETGELRRMTQEERYEMHPEFTPVPKHLQSEADKELGDQESVFVDMSQDTPLTRWATKKRIAYSKKKNKTAKESRKKNRKK